MRRFSKEMVSSKKTVSISDTSLTESVSIRVHQDSSAHSEKRRDLSLAFRQGRTKIHRNLGRVSQPRDKTSFAKNTSSDVSSHSDSDDSVKLDLKLGGQELKSVNFQYRVTFTDK